MASKIPISVQVGPKCHYNVYICGEMLQNIEKHIGETDYNRKELIIKDNLGPKLTTKTYFHEFLHALSDEYHLNLTENQILDFEEALPYLFKFFKELT